MHFGCVNGYSRFYHAFFGWGFISGRGVYWWFSSLGRHPGYFGHFVLMCSSSTFLSHIDNTSFFFFLVYFGQFRQKCYAGIWGHYGFSFVGVLLGLFISLLSMEDCAPSIFLRNWALVAPYFYFRFCIFDKPVLEEYVSQVEGGPHLLKSCLHATWNGFPPATKEMHPSFESLTIINAPSL